MIRLVCFAILALVGQVTLAQTQGAAYAKNIIGTWVGDWSSSRYGGRFEFEIATFDGASLTGRVNSEAQGCTVGWTALSGELVGTSSTAHTQLVDHAAEYGSCFHFPKET